MCVILSLFGLMCNISDYFLFRAKVKAKKATTDTSVSSSAPQGNRATGLTAIVSRCGTKARSLCSCVGVFNNGQVGRG